MRRFYHLLIISTIMTAFTAASFTPVYASSKGRKNTAIALTAATVYSVLQKNDRHALIAGLGTAQAWKSYEDARKRESKQRAYSSSRNYRYSTPSGYGSQGYRRSTKTYRYTGTQSRQRAQYRPVRKASSSTSSSKHVAQMKAQISQLKAQNAALTNKMQLQKLQAENAAMKAELAQQKVLVAEARTNTTASKAQMGIISIIAIAALSIAAFGILPGRWKKN
ncbi:MAG: hypothetical protein ACYC27_12070 [Armatimonadota bacterium]